MPLNTNFLPGELVFTGKEKVEKVMLHYLKYNTNNLEELELSNEKDFSLQEHPDHVDWYDIRGMQDTNLVSKFGTLFNLHPLVLADMVDVNARPKTKESEDSIFLSFKAISYSKNRKEIDLEHVGVLFSSQYLLSIQEDDSDIFDSIRKRIHDAKGLVRSRKGDYLAYGLLDIIVDQYFEEIEHLKEEIEALEDRILNKDIENVRMEILHLRREVQKFIKVVIPLRENVSKLIRSDSPIILKKTKPYFNHLYDQILHVIESLDQTKEFVNSIQDLLQGEMGNRMNEIMQLLTVITTFFVPLSFLTGLYGMNFKYIPELENEYGYFILLGVMFLTFIILLIFFKRRKWL